MSSDDRTALGCGVVFSIVSVGLAVAGGLLSHSIWVGLMTFAGMAVAVAGVGYLWAAGRAESRLLGGILLVAGISMLIGAALLTRNAYLQRVAIVQVTPLPPTATPTPVPTPIPTMAAPEKAILEQLKGATPVGLFIRYLDLTQEFTGNYGWGPLLLGFVLQLILLPLHTWQRRFTEAVGRLQPLFYGASPQMQWELYRRLDINPVTGCLFGILAAILSGGAWVGFMMAFSRLGGAGVGPLGFLWIPDLGLPWGWPHVSPFYAYLILPGLLVVSQWAVLRVMGTIGGGLRYLGALSQGVIAVFVPSGASLFALGMTVGALAAQGVAELLHERAKAKRRREELRRELARMMIEQLRERVEAEPTAEPPAPPAETVPPETLVLPTRPEERAPEETRIWPGEIYPAPMAVVLTGHEGPVRAVAILPDGQRALSVGDDRALIWWDVATGEYLRGLLGHDDAVTSLAISADGQMAMTGSADGGLCLWEVDSGSVTGAFRAQGRVNSLALSPDTKQALIAIRDVYYLILLDLGSGEVLRRFEGHTDEVMAVAFSAQGDFVLSGSCDGMVRMWDTDGHPLRVFEGHAGAVNAVAFSSDGRSVLSGGEDRTIKVWDVLSEECMLTLEGHIGVVNSIALSPDGRGMASGDAEGTVRVWEVERGICADTFEGHSGPVNSVAFSPDGTFVLSAGADGTLRRWEAERWMMLT